MVCKKSVEFLGPNFVIDAARLWFYLVDIQLVVRHLSNAASSWVSEGAISAISASFLLIPPFTAPTNFAAAASSVIGAL